MKAVNLTRLVLPALVLLLVGSCVTASQDALGEALPVFQPFVGTWVKPSATRPFAEVLRIKSVSPNGTVELDFKVQRTDGYREYREFVHEDHVWIATSEATARIEHGKPRIRLKFTPDNTRYPRFGWDSYDLLLPADRQDYLLAIGKAGDRATMVIFDRQ